MSSLAGSNWLLGVGAFHTLAGLAAHFAPKPYLALWGVHDVDAAVSATFQQFGAFAATLGSWYLYAALGDEDEQKHANRVGLFNSLLCAVFWARGGLPYGPDWAHKTSLGLFGFFTLGFGYFAHRLQ